VRIQIVAVARTVAPCVVRISDCQAAGESDRQAVASAVIVLALSSRSADAGSADPRSISSARAAEDAYIGCSTPVAAHVTRRRSPWAL
jgi:hypothetical protein